MSRLTLLAPFPGWCMPLAEVPDPVFQQGMAGDGVAIDPTEGLLRAPCDGELVPMKEARHAISVRANNGVEVLVHVGIDTVALAGQGFERLAEPGRAVRAGDPLVRFDLEFLARHAKSLASPVIVVSGDAVTRRAASGVLRAGDFLMEVERAVAVAGDGAGASRDAGEARHSRRLVVAFAHGLHARPAAQVAAALRPFQADVQLVFRGREAHARSPVALMTLGARAGDTVEVQASGAGALEALAALEQLFAPAIAASAPARHATPAPGRIDAVIASRGFAVGPCARWERPQVAVAERGAGEAGESAALARALDAVVIHLESLHGQSRGEAQALVAAHIELARDPQLRDRASGHMRRGDSAGHAWRQATRATAATLAALDDERMRERAADLLDLEHQVLGVLAGHAPGAAHEFAQGAIVVADELLPSQVLALQRTQVAGVCTARGGATTHMAILAAAAGLPALVAAGDAVLAIAEGVALVLDAEQGFLEVDPPPARRAALERSIDERRSEHAADLAAAHAPALTRDGVRISVLANLGSADEAAAALEHGAEGCGLLRTEFLYLDRREAPPEDEQRREYQRIADALGARPLTIRTMDIGGDKPIAFMPAEAEENPALGLRGVRASLEQPDLLRAQLAAILRVAPAAACRVLVPMVTDASDLRFVKRMLDEERARLGLAHRPLLGAMVETPAAALLADALAAECDFLSLGTNDLAQYTLAIDRAHPRLAARLDALHPAVLRLIARVAEVAQAHGKGVSVCGTLGSDVAALPVLVGLGIHEVSAVASTIPRLKRAARQLDAAECRELARRALEQSSAKAVRELLAAASAPHPAPVTGGSS
ncbi:MAG TPA: phosphoenolpyruvate--protein phosphotransferase [Usitatibacter sp.]|jgi:phosphoenolpyruvate-protein phosphotransferase|nr:phosphoenolpyruvate--protein phosphotransferase [Usitatibacter sp.]